MSPPARTAVPALLRFGVGAAGVLSMVPILLEEGDEPALWVPAVFLIAAAVAVHVPRLGFQLLARAAWWAGLGLGTILSVLGGRRDATLGACLSIGCGIALLASARWLAESTERAGFAATTSRSALLLLMVLALADAQTFALMGIIELYRHRVSPEVTLLGLAAAWVVSFVGMVRLAGWATLLAALTSVLALVTVGLGVVHVHDQSFKVVVVLASLQLLAAAPVLLAAARGRPLVPPLPARVRGLAAAAVIALLMLVALLRVAGLMDRLG